MTEFVTNLNFKLNLLFEVLHPKVYIEKCRVVQKFESETDLYALYDSPVFQTDPSSQLWKKGIIWADNFVPRVDWGAREPKGIENFPIPAEVGVMGHHTAWDRQLGLLKFRESFSLLSSKSAKLGTKF